MIGLIKDRTRELFDDARPYLVVGGIAAVFVVGILVHAKFSAPRIETRIQN